MSNYESFGCGSCQNSYENKMKDFRGSYSGSAGCGKDEYSSGMPDLFMSNYINSKKNY